MSISFTKYINIISGVIGNNQVPARSFGLRVFSINPLIPTNTFVTFTNADDVESFFGSTSTEYAIAKFYFGFVSKTITSPQSIDFSSWVETAVAPTIYGAASATASLATLQAITAGHLNLTLGATTQELTGINLSAASNLAAVATDLTTAINAVTSDPQWHTAVVTYNAQRGAFVLTGGATGASPVSVAAAASGVDVGVAIGWENSNTIYSAGSAAMSLTATLIGSSQASNNFGSFSFIPVLDQAQHVEIGTWLASLNVAFIYQMRVSAANANAYATAVAALAGVNVTLDGNSSGQFPSLLPACVQAATDYTKPNAAQNYMFQQYSVINPNVTDDADSATYDALGVNYYGQTQIDGALIAFYQRGFLMGTTTTPTDIGDFANEMWFKSAMAAAYMNLALALTSIPANANGRAILMSMAQSVIQQALTNGVFSASNDSFTNTQIAAINQQTGNATAWRQVLTIGYWINFTFSSSVVNGRTQYQANYTCVYAKNNSIRFVQGTHALV